MADIRLQLALFDDTPFTGSVRLVPANVTLSGSKVFTLDWIDNDTDFIFENVAPGLYELTASSAIKESPLWCINVPTGSGLYDATDLEFPPTERSLTWLPKFAVSASWASSSISASYVKTAQTASYVLGSNVKGTVLSASYALKSSDSDTLGGQPKAFFQDASNLTSGSLPVGRLSGTYFITASQAQSASYAVLSTTASHASTASYVQNAVSASYAPIPPLVPSASYAQTASVALNGPGIASGSLLNVTSSHALTASFALNVVPTVSASWASASLSASYAEDARFFGGFSPEYFLNASNLASGSLPAARLSGSYGITASVALNAYTASSAVSASYALSASHSQTASYALNALPSVSSSYASASLSSSYALSASYAPQWSIASGSSWNITSSVALTASFVTLAQSASFVTASNIRGTVTSASFAVSASWAPYTTVSSVPSASWASSSLSASYAPNTFTISSGSTWQITASNASNALTASHALSLKNNARIENATLINTATEGTFSLDLPRERALYVDDAGRVVSSTASYVELSYLSGLSGSVQVQLDGRQPLIGTGSFLPITSSHSISASYAPFVPIVEGGRLTVTTSSNYSVLALQGRNFGGTTVELASTPAGLTIDANTYVAGKVTAIEFDGLVHTASFAHTASYVRLAQTASSIPYGIFISGSLLRWGNTELYGNVNARGIILHDNYTDQDVIWTYDDEVYLRNLTVVDTQAGRVVVTNAEGHVTTGVVTLGELDNITGSRSNLQVQIDAKQPKLETGSFYPISASFALSASHYSLTLSTSSSFADSASYALSASYSLSASYAFSSSYALTASYSVTASHAVSAATASYVSGAFSCSYAASASYAITASNLNGWNYDRASYTLPVSQSNLIVMQRVTGSLSSATFTYTARSGSVMAKGIVEAEWLAGDSGSLQWQHDRSPAGRRISIDEAGTKTETTYSADLYMSAVLGGNSIQLRAFASSSVPWNITASAVYI